MVTGSKSRYEAEHGGLEARRASVAMVTGGSRCEPTAFVTDDGVHIEPQW